MLNINILKNFLVVKRKKKIVKNTLKKLLGMTGRD